MLATEILKVCQAHGLTLHVVEGDRLKIRAKGRIDEHLLRLIKNHKKDLIRTLKGEAFFDHHMDMAIGELNSLGVRMMGVSEAKRQEAFVLEEELTAAANTGDRERFLFILEKWRSCFH